MVDTAPAPHSSKQQNDAAAKQKPMHMYIYMHIYIYRRAYAYLCVYVYIDLYRFI